MSKYDFSFKPSFRTIVFVDTATGAHVTWETHPEHRDAIFEYKCWGACAGTALAMPVATAAEIDATGRCKKPLRAQDVDWTGFDAE